MQFQLFVLFYRACWTCYRHHENDQQERLLWGCYCLWGRPYLWGKIDDSHTIIAEEDFLRWLWFSNLMSVFWHMGTCKLQCGSLCVLPPDTLARTCMEKMMLSIAERGWIYLSHGWSEMLCQNPEFQLTCVSVGSFSYPLSTSVSITLLTVVTCLSRTHTCSLIWKEPTVLHLLVRMWSLTSSTHVPNIF